MRERKKRLLQNTEHKLLGPENPDGQEKMDKTTVQKQEKKLVDYRELEN